MNSRTAPKRRLFVGPARYLLASLQSDWLLQSCCTFQYTCIQLPIIVLIVLDLRDAINLHPRAGEINHSKVASPTEVQEAKVRLGNALRTDNLVAKDDKRPRETFAP